MNRKTIIKHLMFIGSFLLLEGIAFGYSLLFTSINPMNLLVEYVGFLPSFLSWMIFINLAVLFAYTGREEKERKRGY